MFRVSSGGRVIAKNTLAPQTKITIVINRGITDHVISSSMPPWLVAPTASGFRRRKRTAQYTMRPAMRSEKKTVTPMRKKYSASTRLAIADARSGNRGVPDHMANQCAADEEPRPVRTYESPGPTRVSGRYVHA